jgi:hypothetical protein
LQRRGHGLVLEPLNGDATIHWLGFHLSKNYSHRPDENRVQIPVEDFYGFNQSTSRNLNPMDEVFVCIEAISTNGCLYWTYDYRGRRFVFRLDVENQDLTVNDSDVELAAVRVTLEGETDSSNRKILVEFSSIDLELVVWINKREYFRQTLPESDGPVSHSLLDFGAAEGQLTIDRIRIWRDLYYLPATAGESGAGGKFAAADGYILFGDNVPISVDSRHWPTQRLAPAKIIGKVKKR